MKNIKKANTINTISAINIIKINKNDNVCIALNNLLKDQQIIVDGVAVILRDNIPAGHKVACCGILKGEKLIKYGNSIGMATSDIYAGEWVHTHNLSSSISTHGEYSYTQYSNEFNHTLSDSFSGFVRPDGQVGIRNEIWIIPTVGCVNSAARSLAIKCTAVRPHTVDGIYAFEHPYGCSQLGSDHENTKKLLCSLSKNPNAAGVLFLGLGCENNHIEGMKECLGSYDTNRFRFLECQSCEDEMEAGTALVNELCEYAGGFTREQVPLSKLVVGLKCGGSDGFSGISANVITGIISDAITTHGGSAILTEVPEMFGAEHLLMERCINEDIFHKTVNMINDFKLYYSQNNLPVYENPSPGNKEGGITTLEEKSLGCVQKGGMSPVVDVVSYGDRLKAPGLNLLNGPGNDLVSTTAMAAAGAQIILFTTGRGTPFGSPVPTIKISSNHTIATAKPKWIDFDASPVLSGADAQTIAEELYKLIKDIASGVVKTRNETYGARDIAIFKNGVTL